MPGLTYMWMQMNKGREQLPAWQICVILGLIVVCIVAVLVALDKTDK